jgi:hypothetical protein
LNPLQNKGFFFGELPSARNGLQKSGSDDRR